MRQEWIVDRYFDVGQRVTHWLGDQVVKYHRTVEEYFLGLQTAGFAEMVAANGIPKLHPAVIVTPSDRITPAAP